MGEISRGTGESLETCTSRWMLTTAMGASPERVPKYSVAKVSDKQVGMTIVTMLKDNDQLQCTALRNERGDRSLNSPTPHWGVGLPPPRLCSDPLFLLLLSQSYG